jgi:hypothetical protein
MASRVTIYGANRDADVKRLQRELNAMYVEYTMADPATDERVQRHLHEYLGDVDRFPLVEVQTQGGNGSVFMTDPDEPTLRQCLLSEDILSVTAYWV